LISIRKYWQGPPQDHSGELVEAVRLLLEGIEAHSTAADQSSCDHFQQDLRKLADSISRQSPSQILAAAGVVAKAMEESSDRAARYAQSRWQEMDKALAMSTHAVAVVSAACEDRGKNLREIDQLLEQASGATDSAGVAARLAECLRRLQDETRRQQEQFAQSLADLRPQLQRLEKLGAEMHLGPATDTVTGLEGRDAAGQALATAIERRGPLVGAAFLVERVQLINARFGYATGDQVLQSYSHHLAGLLEPGDRLFRWTGPVFVALMERTVPLEQIQTELDRISSANLEIAVQIGNGSVLIPVTSASALFPLAQMSSVFELARRIDAFIHEQAQRQ
jgi:GGDEF domain-containing protein